MENQCQKIDKRGKSIIKSDNFDKDFSILERIAEKAKEICQKEYDENRSVQEENRR